MSRYGRISYGTKMAMRSYARRHTLSVTARKFGVSATTVWLCVNFPIKEPAMTCSKEAQEPYTCTTFGCGRTLTREEKLYGNKCIHHSKIYIQ
jgi:hypothetical protein